MTEPSAATPPLLDVRGLTRRYGDFAAVSNLSFQVSAGEIVGFLGPNGAGKSTTMRMLTTYLPPTEGTATVCGADIVEDAARVREQIGYLPETPPVYPEMRVERYLRFVARIRQVPRGQIGERVNWAIEACGLADRRRQIIGTLSKGYRQRVGIAQAIVHDPRVLILDEPTSGLDPNQILEIRDLIRRLGEGRTILLSTHILQEVRSVCDRVLILHNGHLAFDAPLDDSLDLEKTFIDLTTRVTESEAA
ncbi:MAG: ABC transporter ATP-binding protein [Candidatus Dadabacteria bacterium]|nr:MAG: ABC transporter ATP-binding protein [Candidatus Dadabacteria bacterium]